MEDKGDTQDVLLLASSVPYGMAHIISEEGELLKGPTISIPVVGAPPASVTGSTTSAALAGLPSVAISPLPLVPSKPLQTSNPGNANGANASTSSSSNAASDVATVIDGVPYNNRGYEICGQLNQHSKPCQRIGRCPFHPNNGKRASPEVGSPTATKKAKTKSGIQKSPFKQGWTKEEHLRFLNGLQLHGKGAWKEIAAIVSTRTPTQIQSHAQKYYLRQKQENKNKRSIHDTSLEDLIDTTSQQVPKNQAPPVATPATPVNVLNVPRQLTQIQCPPMALINSQTGQFTIPQLAPDQFPIVFANTININQPLASFPYPPLLSTNPFGTKLINITEAAPTFQFPHIMAAPIALTPEQLEAACMARTFIGLPESVREDDSDDLHPQPAQILLPQGQALHPATIHSLQQLQPIQTIQTLPTLQALQPIQIHLQHPPTAATPPPPPPPSQSHHQLSPSQARVRSPSRARRGAQPPSQSRPQVLLPQQPEPEEQRPPPPPPPPPRSLISPREDLSASASLHRPPQEEPPPSLSLDHDRSPSPPPHEDHHDLVPADDPTEESHSLHEVDVKVLVEDGCDSFHHEKLDRRVPRFNMIFDDHREEKILNQKSNEPHRQPNQNDISSYL